MEKVLQSYLRKLNNLSGNNRSLLLLRLISDQFLDLNELDYAQDQPSFSIIQDLIAQKNEIKLCDEVDPRDQQTNSISQKLRKIFRIEQFIFEERGARDLYIGWPFVRGKFNDGTLVRCPLIFFPVSLHRHKNGWYLHQRKEVNITLNKTFLLAYAYYNKVSLDEDLIELVLGEFDKDSTLYRTQLYELLKNSQVEINFNQDNFIDKLHAFKSYKKNEFESAEKNGHLKIFPEALLGIFPQSGSYLVPDYVRLLDKDINDLADFFSKRIKKDPEGKQNVKFSDQVKEETTFTPFEIDSSQEYALKLVKNGNSLVVQGPPGTGKSQLICNLISDFIARGKNVLLVCQKRAALDVVYERLRSQELHDFIGLVHDFKNDRKEIFDQISRQIDNLDEYRQKNNSLDAIYLERTFLKTSRKIDQVTEELSEFKDALFDEKECGKSIKELYLTSNPDALAIPINQEYRGFEYHYADEFVIKLSRFLDYHEKFERNPHFWSKGPTFSSFNTHDLIRIKEIIDEIPDYHNHLKEESKTFSSIPLDFESCLHFLSLKEELEQLKTNLDNEAVYKFYRHMLSRESGEDPLWLSNLERTMLQCFKGSGPEISLKSHELGRFQEALEHAIKARKGLISWIRWKIFSQDKIFITRVLVANDLKSNKQGFEVLLERIDNRLNYEHIVSRIYGADWLIEFPKNIRKIDIQNWFFYQKLALKSVQLTRKIRALPEILSPKETRRAQFIDRVSRFLSFLDQIPTQLQLWSRYISETQVRSLLLNKIDVEYARKQLNEDFDALVEYNKIQENFTNDEDKIINELLDKELQSNEEIVNLFKNSLALAWIDHIETKYPVLKSVSSFKLDHLVQDLQQAILDKMDISREILLLKSRERTYEDLEYNRLNNLVTYKDLYHQVTKKKKIWPIRKVISSFHEEVFSLLPCWMASPESASAIFPMEEMFDLVIFDEASQCFAERGIPAMYRGKQVVIAGDDKQLQPNDLYRVRWEEEEEELPELEVDSLLSLAKQYLKEVSLRGHYRSKSLELIEFSNLNFYNGKLKLLPDFHLAKRREPAIRYFKTEGVWKNNANEEEAHEVIKLINKITRDKQDKSVGVVTFNIRQQTCILDLIDRLLDAGQVKLPESFFVKNIENVQGDEKDIIIFSTAYAPDEKGKLQLRFGSLNTAGGENRLNVAVTRAREEVYVVTSILPHQLNVENTINAGPKLLQAYLQYAWDVSNGDWVPSGLVDKNHSPDWYLRSRLTRDEGKFSIRKELPFSDLTVIGSKEYKGLILTDDDLLFDTLTPKEAHCYRQAHFIEKNWPFIQFYSREFWANQEKTQEKMDKFITRIMD